MLDGNRVVVLDDDAAAAWWLGEEEASCCCCPWAEELAAAGLQQYLMCKAGMGVLQVGDMSQM